MTDDVYARKLSLRPGWLKIGHSADLNRRYSNGDEDGVILEVWPGGGYEMEQWLHHELEQVYERDGRTERFRVDIRAVRLAVSIGARNGVEFVARAVLEKAVREQQRRLLSEREADRQRQLAVRQVNYSREETEKARKAVQPAYVPKFQPIPRVIERGKQHGEHPQRSGHPDRDLVPDAE